MAQALAQQLDAATQIDLFKEFFENTFHAELLENIRRGKNRIVVEFDELAKFSPELADLLLEEPENTLKAASIAVEQLEGAKDFHVRFSDLPASQNIAIRNLRAQHLAKFIQLTGIVRQKTDVRPQVTSARFECPSCGNIISVLQLDSKFREPSSCGQCGRKGKFRLLSKELVDAQKIVLEESPDNLDGGEQPKRLNIFLYRDLVAPMTDKRTNPGSKIAVTGYLKEVPVTLSTGGQSTRFDLVLESNFVNPVEEDYSQINISPEEKAEIEELSKKPDVFETLVGSLAPSIYGHERIKQAMVLQLLGGVKKQRSDGVVTRGDMHILLVGDPGAGKSQLLKRAEKVAPKSRFVSGKGASGAGLTASVVKDEFMRGWALEAGALVLANKGFCMIDELDKMSQEDRSAFHEALEQQTVTISKANIQATLRCETVVLAAANPKFGRFDPYEMLAKQIELPSTLINRFDLIFPVRDIPDQQKDEKMANFILKLHQTGDVKDVSVETEKLTKYISYARGSVFPRLTDEALKEIQDFYVEMRNSGSGEEGISAIPISARQLEALVRLGEASARARLSEEVTKEDAKRSIGLVMHCLEQLGVDPDTGKMDIDRLTTGVTASTRNQVHTIKQIIKELAELTGNPLVPEEEILAKAEEKGIDELKAEEILEKLNRLGDIFRPKPGYYSMMQ